MLPASGSNYDLILEALKKRGGIMFEGKDGAAIRSGIDSDAASAEKPTYGLCRAAIYVVFNVLPDVLFDPLAQHRPCGVLDRYEAVGMLIGDALGLPLMPARPQGLAVGKRARKLEQTISAETDKQKKADKRRGEDGSGAAAAALSREVKLPLPTAQECLASAPAEPEVTHDPAPLPTAPPPTTPPPTAPPPTAPPPTAPAPAVARTAGGKVLRLQGSGLGEAAVRAAIGCEVAQTWLREGVDEPIGVPPGWEAFDAKARERHQDYRWDTYLDALIAIKERFPMKVCCDYFEIGGCKHGIRCECGGKQAPWPWIIHHPTASPFCECHLALRRDWVRFGLQGPQSSAKLIAHIERMESGRFRPECQREGYRCGCMCNVCADECSEEAGE